MEALIHAGTAQAREHPLAQAMRTLSSQARPGLLILLSDLGTDGDPIAVEAESLALRGTQVIWPGSVRAQGTGLE
jgi:hypothetical protein